MVKKAAIKMSNKDVSKWDEGNTAYAGAGAGGGKGPHFLPQTRKILFQAPILIISKVKK